MPKEQKSRNTFSPPLTDHIGKFRNSEIISGVDCVLSTDVKYDMTKSAANSTTTSAGSTSPSNTPENSIKGDKKKKSIIPKIFTSKKNSRTNSDEDLFQSDGVVQDLDKRIAARRKALFETTPAMKKGFSERHSSAGIEGLNLSSFDQPMTPATLIQDIRILVATWNVGGRTPTEGLNLEDFLQVEGSADIFILGFQEIVPLSAGNVLVIEDNEPAAKWITLISQALNKPMHCSLEDSCDLSGSHSKHSKSNLFHKPTLKVLSKNLRVDSTLLKACNCPLDSKSNKRKPHKLIDPSASPFPRRDASNDDLLSIADISPTKLNYCLVASKQMVGIFLSIWARRDLVQHIGHLGISCIGRGIMGCLGNKGCISISLSLHQTSFCFVCSHLASGEKEGDELKRNSDVAEILKSTQFSRNCKNPDRRVPERIMDHDRVIWLGDLNYRLSLSYEKARLLLEDNDWHSLLEKDQLNIERAGGRVFTGFSEGKIFFAPTYKYTHNSDSYAGETVKSKKKRRTPAWCDRILWYGNGIEQLSYIRGESRFSDHRPVCAVFAVEVEMKNDKPTTRFRKGYSCAATRMDYEDCIPQRHSFYDY